MSRGVGGVIYTGKSKFLDKFKPRSLLHSLIATKVCGAEVVLGLRPERHRVDPGFGGNAVPHVDRGRHICPGATLCKWPPDDAVGTLSVPRSKENSSLLTDFEVRSRTGETLGADLCFADRVGIASHFSFDADCVVPPPADVGFDLFEAGRRRPSVEERHLDRDDQLGHQLVGRPVCYPLATGLSSVDDRAVSTIRLIQGV